MVRLKNRYIVTQVVQFTPTATLRLNDATIAKSVLQNVHKYYGDYGLALVEHGFRIKYCNDRTKIAIIRCSHDSHRFTTSILPLITMIGDVRAKFLTLYTGATIIQCNKFIIRHQRALLERTVGEIVSAKERQDFIKEVMVYDLQN